MKANLSPKGLNRKKETSIKSFANLFSLMSLIALTIALLPPNLWAQAGPWVYLDDNDPTISGNTTTIFQVGINTLINAGTYATTGTGSVGSEVALQQVSISYGAPSLCFQGTVGSGSRGTKNTTF